MNTYKTKWTGSYPSLCCGEWRLYKNDKYVDIPIPFQGGPAGTYKEYSTWSFGEDYEEEWEYYTDGLELEAWVNQYIDYLKQVTDNPAEYEAIFDAFKDNDWRHHSCGGCI